MKTVDLFCGVGGLSLGLELAGVEVAAGIDAWPQALQVYERNHSHDAFELDLSDVKNAVKVISNYEVDMIAGGPPCQDFSHAGKRVEGNRADLTLAFAKIVTKIQPEWFIMENVDRSQNSLAYADARKLYKKAGYGLTETLLDASFCGVPQKRKRFFCIGKLGADDNFLMPVIESKLSASPMTVRDYLGNELKLTNYYRHPRSYLRRGVFSIDEPSPTVRGVNRPVPKGYPGHAIDTAPAHSVRPLTTLERARIQTFPNDYHWIGNKTEIEQFIGNAVPVNLARFVGECVMAYAKHRRRIAEYPKVISYKGQLRLCEPDAPPYINKRKGKALAMA